MSLSWSNQAACRACCKAALHMMTSQINYHPNCFGCAGDDFNVYFFFGEILSVMFVEEFNILCHSDVLGLVQSLVKVLLNILALINSYIWFLFFCETGYQQAKSGVNPLPTNFKYIQLLCISEKSVKKMSAAVPVFNETTVVLFTIWSIMLLLMSWNAKDAEHIFQPSCQGFWGIFNILASGCT